MTSPSINGFGRVTKSTRTLGQRTGRGETDGTRLGDNPAKWALKRYFEEE
jgi:hypothetical protein